MSNKETKEEKREKKEFIEGIKQMSSEQRADLKEALKKVNEEKEKEDEENKEEETKTKIDYEEIAKKVLETIEKGRDFGGKGGLNNTQTKKTLREKTIDNIKQGKTY